MSEYRTQWRVTTVDGGTGKEETKVVDLIGGSISMLECLPRITSDMALNSIHKLTVEYISPETYAREKIG